MFCDMFKPFKRHHFTDKHTDKQTDKQTERERLGFSSRCFEISVRLLRVAKFLNCVQEQYYCNEQFAIDIVR